MTHVCIAVFIECHWV